MGGTVREQVAQVLRLRRGGASYAEIASAVGCSRNTVSYLLGFARLDPLDLADFLAGRLSLSQAERLIRTAPRLPRGWSSGGEGVLVREREELVGEVARLRVQVEEIKRFLEVVKKMAGLVSVDLLKPHPKNSYYYSDPTPEEYEQIKRSIAEHGIRDPLKVLPDYTVVGGCLRLRVAKELGLTHVPVEIWDVPSEEAEYLLVADNDERRTCLDPVRKARRAEVLKRRWGVRQGSANPKGTVVPREGKNYPDGGATLDAVAQAVGETRENLKRLLKLNDLIPPLQELVSRGVLSQTAAYSLAFLPREEQERLLVALGESGLGGLSVQEAQELRRQLDAERTRIAQGEARIRDLERQLATARATSGESEKLVAELARLREENERLKARGPEVVEKVVEKVVTRPDAAQEAEIKKLRAQVEQLEARLRDATGEEEVARLRQTKAELEAEVRYLERTRQRLGEAVSCLAFCRKLLDPLIQNEPEFRERIARTRFTGAFVLDPVRWIGVLERYVELLREAVEVGRKGEVYDVMAVDVEDATWKEGAGGERA